MTNLGNTPSSSSKQKIKEKKQKSREKNKEGRPKRASKRTSASRDDDGDEENYRE